MSQTEPIYPVYGWNQSDLDFNRWLGNATAATILKLGSHVRHGPSIGYAPVGKYPLGWAYQHAPRSHPS
jgi:hypothetical protein